MPAAESAAGEMSGIPLAVPGTMRRGAPDDVSVRITCENMAFAAFAMWYTQYGLTLVSTACAQEEGVGVTHGSGAVQLGGSACRSHGQRTFVHGRPVDLTTPLHTPYTDDTPSCTTWSARLTLNEKVPRSRAGTNTAPAMR